MPANSRSPVRFSPWLSALLLGLLAATIATSGLGGRLSAQDQKPKQTRPKEEIEDPVKPGRKPVPKVGDEDLDTKPAPPPRAASRVGDLEREAQNAKNASVAALFRGVAHPHDLLKLPNGTILRVKPIPTYVGMAPSFRGKITIQPYDEKWKLGKSFSRSQSDIAGVEPYETMALALVDEFLRGDFDKNLPDGQKPLPRLEKYQEAEKVIAALLAFHESAWETGQRSGDEWKKIKTELRGRLQSIQVSQVRALADAKNWLDAFALATRLTELYPRDRDLQNEVARLLAANAEQAVESRNYLEARRRLLLLENQFPDSSEINPVREKLKARVAEMRREAETLVNEGKMQQALDRLQEAENVYPDPGVHELRRKLGRKFPVLYVGVRELPVLLSPTLAASDAEKQAVELLFESLVRVSAQSPGMDRYVPALAADMPRLVPLGREFELQRNARWSDGQRVTATDVRHTVNLLSDRNWPGRPHEWADLMGEGARIESDQYHITLNMRQGFLDPLFLMSFKILPQHRARRADDQDFARAPVSSGPYRFKGLEDGHAVFIANTYYESRPGKHDLPHVHEIHMVVSKSPIDDFGRDRLHLLLDLPTRRFQEMKSANPRDVELITLPSRRVYFLAVNHRHGALRDVSLRRAIAHAIPRERILDEYFRAGLASKPHRPLNGPFPPQTWPCKPSLPADPYLPDLAKTLAEKAKASGSTREKLTLKYPAGDPAVASACKMIADQVEALGVGLHIELVERGERDLRHEVQDDHDFQLAYYSYDFANEAYWIWPLFDPQAAENGGSNYLGYQNDGELESLFHRAMAHRDFSLVRKFTQDIHDRLYDQMPIIPLWQLDNHLAIHKSVNPTNLSDPIRVFTDVENWTLEKQ